MAKEGDNSLGLASFILGILSISFFFMAIPPLVFGILGIVFGLIQRKRSNNKWATWGLILSVVGVLLSLFVLISVLAGIISLYGAVHQISSCMSNPNLPGCDQVINAVAKAVGGSA